MQICQLHVHAESILFQHILNTKGYLKYKADQI